ncbi:MAG: HAMP domain-containing sensor histidine kinase, partial [Cyanobacteria bacterium P01_C01_bin.120]
AGIGWLLSGLAIAPIRTAYQQLKQFTADASHELRNPIAVIQTNVQVALADPEPDLAQQQGQLQVIERLTRRLGKLVDDLLFLARQEGGLVPVQREAVALVPLLKDIVEEQSAIAADSAIQLSLQLPPVDSAKSSPTIKGDANQIVRLMTNLVSNALQHTPAGGQVSLQINSLRQNNQPQVQITVADTGVGIAPENLPRVFDRFYRVDPARSRRAGGNSGLGLAIAKVIVDNHRGHIYIDSQMGQGTQVSVFLPQHLDDSA